MPAMLKRVATIILVVCGCIAESSCSSLTGKVRNAIPSIGTGPVRVHRVRQPDDHWKDDVESVTVDVADGTPVHSSIVNWLAHMDASGTRLLSSHAPLKIMIELEGLHIYLEPPMVLFDKPRGFQSLRPMTVEDEKIYNQLLTLFEEHSESGPADSGPHE